MTVWKQAIFAAIATVLAVVGMAVFVPATRPMLDRLGLLDPINRIGLAQAPAEQAAGPQGGPGGPPGAGPGRAGMGGPGMGGPGMGGGGAAVIASAPGQGVINNIVAAIGNGQALHSVTLAPETGGRVVEIGPAPGDLVAEGSVIMRLDDANERIALDRARLMLENARATQARLARLQSSGTATELQISDAALAVSTAELALREAEFQLDRRSILAPIAGWVGLIGISVGDQVATGTEIARIDDRSRILVEFRVPERFVGQFAEGYALTATPLARPDRPMQGTVTAVDNRVDQTSRSLAVRAEIDNPDDTLRAGMAFSIEMEFPGETHPAVDPLAIQWGRDGAFVWAVRDGVALQVPVRIVQRNADEVLVSADFADGDLIVTEGVQMLRPGGAVTVAGPDRQGGDGATAAAGGNARG